MNANDTGYLRSSYSSGLHQPLSDEHEALQVLEHIEHSLVDLRQMLEVSAQRQSVAAESPSTAHAATHDSTSDPNQPLRIVLMKESESAPNRRSPLPLGKALSGCSPAELTAALKQRDDYIVYLCGTIQEMTIRIEAWLRLLQERSLNEETAVVLRDAEACVRQLVKTMEIELAIERAEVGRERAQLEADRRAFEIEMEKAAQCGMAPADTSAETPMMQRWRRFLTVPPAPRASPMRSGTSGTGP